MKPYNKQQTVINRHFESTARNLIADLIGDKDITHQQGIYRLEAAMLPESMTFEADVLKVIYLLTANNIAPTKEAVTQRLLAQYEDAERRINGLLNSASPAGPQIPMLAFAIGHSIEQERMHIAIKDMASMVTTAQFDRPETLYEKLSEMLQKAAPLATVSKTVSLQNAAEEYKKKHEERRKRLEMGTANGPTTPWEKLNAKLDCLSAGDMWTWVAKPGHGKTTIASQLADHIAYKQGGYYVHFILLETGEMTQEERRYCRELNMTPYVFRRQNISEGPVAEEISKIDNRVAMCEKTKGHIEYDFAPGVSLPALMQKMADHATRAKAVGLKYVAMIDYLQEVSIPGMLVTDAAKNNIVATEIKNMAQRLGCHVHLFSQIAPDSDYSNRQAGYNGSASYFRSQAFIRLERSNDTANADRPVVDRHGKQIHNILGQPLFYHRNGQMTSEAAFNVLKANDGQLGKVDIIFFSGCFKIVDPSESQKSDVPF